MNTKKADEILNQIAELAQQIEDDKELLRIDSRYHVCAKWIDTDIECCDPI